MGESMKERGVVEGWGGGIKERETMDFGTVMLDHQPRNNTVF